MGEFLPDGRDRFRVVVDNVGDDMAADGLYLYDPLSGVGVVAWAVDSPTSDRTDCAVTSGNAPDPPQQALECVLDAGIARLGSGRHQAQRH